MLQPCSRFPVLLARSPVLQPGMEMSHWTQGRRTPPLTAQQLKRRQEALNKWFLSSFSTAIIKSFSYVTPMFAFLSTATSLGALLFSGYHPDNELNCKWMTVILATSYVSIVWNLLFYLMYIPTVTRLIQRLVPADQNRAEEAP
jgi:hypothetical protein